MIVSAFGYSVPFTVVLVALALLLGLAITVMFWLTIGLSVYRSVQDTQRNRVRDELQTELLDGVFSSDTDWTQWVEGLSATERDVVESLLDEYLRELDGENVAQLQDLGAILGIPNRSKQWLKYGGEYKRLHALTWLTLLGCPEQLEQTDFTPRTSRERAAVVRLRYDCDDLNNPREGLRLLLDNVSTQFTVFGQDTLYRVALDDPSALFEVSAVNYQTWSEPLLLQVLVVCQHLGNSVTTENVSWVTSMLEHENKAVRAAAARALRNVGWRSDIRDGPFLDRVINDPSPMVRGAVSQMLAEWGDSQALDALRNQLETEANPRSRLIGTNALVRSGERFHVDISQPLATAMVWSTEHAEYDDIARQRRQQVAD